MTEKMRSSRAELFDLIWSEPMIRVAERFGVTATYLVRVCDALHLPRPKPGYWQKLAVGKASARPALPDAPSRSPQTWAPGDPLPSADNPPATPRSSPISNATRLRQITPNTNHALLAGARHHFEAGRTVDEHAYLKPYKRLLLDVNASKAGLEKALGFANALYNALKARGHRVTLPANEAGLRAQRPDEREAATEKRPYYEHSPLWSPQRPTVVYIDGVAIGLTIVEMTERTTLRYVGGKYIRETDYVPPRRGFGGGYSFTTSKDIPSGRLRLVAYAPQGRICWSNQWQEMPTRSLMTMIPAIVRAIEAMEPELTARLEEPERKAEIAHQEWLAHMEQSRRAEDTKRIQESVGASTTQLGEIIDRWTKTMAVERFFQTIEDRAGDLPTAEADQLMERVKLGRSFVGANDPLAFLLDWKTPVELYQPRYDSDALAGD